MWLGSLAGAPSPEGVLAVGPQPSQRDPDQACPASKAALRHPPGAALRTLGFLRCPSLWGVSWGQGLGGGPLYTPSPGHRPPVAQLLPRLHEDVSGPARALVSRA